MERLKKDDLVRFVGCSRRRHGELDCSQCKHFTPGISDNLRRLCEQSIGKSFQISSDQLSYSDWVLVEGSVVGLFRPYLKKITPIEAMVDETW